MTDDTEKPEQAEVADTEGPLAGERLAQARHEQQISINEIAKELHLDEHKVRALERNEFDILGAPVFAKGYLRKYAQLVGVRVDDVLADYHHMNRAIGVPPVVSLRARPRQELSPGPWIAVIVVIVIAVSAFWWFTRSTPTPVSEPAASSEIAPAETDAAETEAAEPDADDMEAEPEGSQDETAAEEPAPAPMRTAAPMPTIEETSSPEIVPGQMRLLLTYTGDCWTEISDANGRRLLFDLGKDGRTVELSGAEPFNVLFGSPGNVSVRVNGEDYALPPTNRPDRPMRLTIASN